MNEIITDPEILKFSKWFVESRKLGISAMDQLFNRLDGLYPHKWKSNFPSPESIDNWRVSWAEAFEQDGITLHEVADGLKNCRKLYEWPPSCMEFVSACRPNLSAEVAFYEAVRQGAARESGRPDVWSHPAIYWAWRSILSVEFRTSSYAVLKVRWAEALRLEMEKGSWEAVPENVLQVGMDHGKTALCAKGRQEIAKAIAAVKTADSRIDHLRWARVIVEKVAAGDVTVPMLAERQAREALGLR